MTTETENQTGFGLLGSILKRPEVRNTWYNGKEVKIDGFHFIGCRFDNCSLIVTSTNFEIENCYIDAGTKISYSGEIIKPIRLFNSRYDWVYQNAPFFAPTKNADGTITIKG